MYRDVRPDTTGSDTASTPEVWAENFAHAVPVAGWRLRRWGLTREARLIRRYVPAGGTIVDAGSGAGEWVAYLTFAGYRAIGVDFSPDLIRRARAAYPHAEWLQSDIRTMALDDDSVDGIVSWGVIEHDEAGPGAALREFLRVLKPGGHAIVTVPVDTPVARHALEVLRPRGDRQVFFQYLMTRAELHRECVAAGFEIVTVGALPSPHIAHIVPRLYPRLPRRAIYPASIVLHALLFWTTRYDVMQCAVLRKP